MNQRMFLALSAVGLVMFAAAPLLIAQAPYESTMGLIQKIFYFHVPGWIAMFLAVFVAGGTSPRPTGSRWRRRNWRCCSASSAW